MLFSLFKKNNEPVTVIGKGYNLKDPKRKIKQIVLPDSNRKGHFWCFGTTRVGKSLSVDALVHTPDGWKRIGDIKVGDKVTTPYNGVATVTGVFPQGELDLYKVIFEDGRWVEASADHLWEIHHRHWRGKYKPGVSRAGKAKPRILTTEQLKAQIESNKGKFGVRLIKPVSKPKKNLPVHPYVLGVLLGDGDLRDLKITVSSKEVISRFEKFLPEDVKLVLDKDRKTVFEYLIRAKDGKHNPIRTFLKEKELFNKRSWQKFIPEEYLESDIEDRLELMRGLLDTDGYVGECGGIVYTTTSKQLAKDFQKLAWSLGCIAYIREKHKKYTYNGEKKNGRVSYNISIRAYDNPRDLITRPNRRERLPVNYAYKNMTLGVKEIVYSRKAEAVCIKIDTEDGLFITDSYIVTHNTRLMENMIEQDIRKGYSVVVLDPKGDIELFSKIVQVAMEERRTNELIFVTPIFPQYSAVVDPLSYYYMPEELVAHIVSGVEGGREPFFYNVAYEISLAVVNSFLMKAKETGEAVNFNLLDIKNSITHEALEKIKDEISALDDEGSVQLARDLQSILNSPQDYYSKVSSSLRVTLTELTSGNVGKIIGKADSNRFIKYLEHGQRVILIVHLGSLLTSRAAFTVGKVILSMIQSFVGRVFSSGKKVNPPLAVYIDEAQNVLYHHIDDFFAKGGGANVWLHGFCQSVSQIYAELGEEKGNAILDNTNTKVFMRVPDTVTAEYVSGFFGKKKFFSPILGAGGSVTTRETEDYVVKPEDVLQLKPRQFYYTSYNGIYKGITNDVSEAYIEVKFPKPEVKGRE